MLIPIITKSQAMKSLTYLATKIDNEVVETGSLLSSLQKSKTKSIINSSNKFSLTIQCNIKTYVFIDLREAERFDRFSSVIFNRKINIVALIKT